MGAVFNIAAEGDQIIPKDCVHCSNYGTPNCASFNKAVQGGENEIDLIKMVKDAREKSGLPLTECSTTTAHTKEI